MSCAAEDCRIYTLHHSSGFGTILSNSAHDHSNLPCWGVGFCTMIASSVKFFKMLFNSLLGAEGIYVHLEM